MGPKTAVPSDSDEFILEVTRGEFKATFPNLYPAIDRIDREILRGRRHPGIDLFLLAFCALFEAQVGPDLGLTLMPAEVAAAMRWMQQGRHIYATPEKAYELMELYRNAEALVGPNADEFRAAVASIYLRRRTN